MTTSSQTTTYILKKGIKLSIIITNLARGTRLKDRLIKLQLGMEGSREGVC